MSDLFEEDTQDGLECFKFQLFLDDYVSCSSRKPKKNIMSAAKPRERSPSVKYSDRKAGIFEYPSGETRLPPESTFRRVYDLINEQEFKESGPASADKKVKKGQKNLTPETNYTQKESDHEDEVKSVKAKSIRKDYNIWGCRKLPKEEESGSKKTLTAFSQAYEPDFHSTTNDQADPLTFDLEVLKLVRAPKKNSMALPEAPIDLMQSLKPASRKLSFPQDRAFDLSRGLPLVFDPLQKGSTRRLASFVQPRLSETLSALESLINKEIAQHSARVSVLE
jgi:hypothetical protein